MKKIIITTRWTDGDVLPFIRIGKSLKNKGYEVIIHTHCVYKECIENFGMKFIPIDTVEQYRNMMKDMLGGIDSMSSNEEIDNFRKKYENIELRYHEFNRIADICKGDNTIILCKNRSEISSLFAAEKYNIPCIQVFMAPYELISIENFEEFYGKKVLNEFNDLREKVGLEPIEKWIDITRKPRYNIALWPEWFDDVDDVLDMKLMYVGFPWQEKSIVGCDNSNFSKFNKLIEQKDELYLITGGTSRMLKSDFYSICINALSSARKNAVVLTKYRDLLPEYLPENIFYFDYLPLDSVMRSFTAILHHGGIGTTCGALAKGIPQLILGHYVDRPYNGRIMKRLGISEYLPPARWSNDNIINAVNKIISEDKLQSAKLYVDKCRKDNAVENLISVVNAVFEEMK